MMFLTKNANGGKISPNKKCQIIKGRGKATLIFSLWVSTAADSLSRRIEVCAPRNYWHGPRCSSLFHQGMGIIVRPHALHVALAGRGYRLFVVMGVDLSGCGLKR